jgi:putative sterol carrier protein
MSQNAREIILSLPTRLKPGTADGLNFYYHFIISGSRGGSFTVSIADGRCHVSETLTGDEPKCVIQTSDETYEEVEYGRTNAQMAVMFGKIKVSNIPSMLKFVEMFNRLS